VKPASLDPNGNWGTLILDATYVPGDIPYPVFFGVRTERSTHPWHAGNPVNKIQQALIQQVISATLILM